MGALAPVRSDHCLVTGASSGLGVAFAEALAPRARLLTLTARRQDRLEALAARLAAAHGVTCRVITADLGAPAGAEALAAAVRAGGTPLDLLVNNAGFGRHAAFDDHPWDDHRRMYEVNVVAPAALMRLFWDDLTGAPGRGVITVASTAAFQPVPWFASYAASKAFARVLAIGVAGEARARGTRIMALCPGPVPTEFGEVAGTNVRLKKVSLSAERVVRTALAAYARGRVQCVPGLLNKVLATAGARLPLGAVVRLAAFLARR